MLPASVYRSNAGTLNRQPRHLDVQAASSWAQSKERSFSAPSGKSRFFGVGCGRLPRGEAGRLATAMAESS